MTYIASQMTSQVEIDELQKTFSALDSNHDGNSHKIYV
jgi:Ca2+-binding EF-hand superfamily protein